MATPSASVNRPQPYIYGEKPQVQRLDGRLPTRQSHNYIMTSQRLKAPESRYVLQDGRVTKVTSNRTVVDDNGNEYDSIDISRAQRCEEDMRQVYDETHTQDEEDEEEETQTSSSVADESAIAMCPCCQMPINFIYVKQMITPSNDNPTVEKRELPQAFYKDEPPITKRPLGQKEVKVVEYL